MILADNVRSQIVAIIKGSSRKGVRLLNTTSNVWSERIRLPSHVLLNGSNLYGAAAPDRDELYVFAYGRTSTTSTYALYRYHPGPQIWEGVDLPVELQRGAPVLDYDSRNGLLVFVLPPTAVRPIEVWTWDPTTEVWESLPQSGQAPTNRRGIGRRHFVYLAAFNVFVCLEVLSVYCGVLGADACGGRTKTWIYRLRR
jgi:hypothetical protein